jgi:hypothetical protein
VLKIVMATHPLFGSAMAVVFDFEGNNVVLLPAAYPEKDSMIFREDRARPFFNYAEPVNKPLYEGAALAFLKKNSLRIDEASFMAAWAAA